MHKIVYVNSINETIDFSSLGVVMDLSGIFSHKWKEELLYQKIVGFKRKQEAIPITLFLKGDSAYANTEFILDAIEKDVASVKSGMLKYGEWYLPGYFSTQKTTGFYKCSSSIKMTLEFVTDVDKWRRENLFTYRTNDESVEERGLGYSYGYPYDFLSSINAQNLYNYSYTDSNFILNVYGPVINPAVTIAGNTYKVNTELLNNEYLTINTRDKTIVKTTPKGEKVNEYANRSLDDYVFKKIPTGMNTVAVTPNCNFDIVVIEERSEPKWT